MFANGTIPLVPPSGPTKTSMTPARDDLAPNVDGAEKPGLKDEGAASAANDPELNVIHQIITYSESNPNNEPPSQLDDEELARRAIGYGLAYKERIDHCWEELADKQRVWDETVRVLGGTNK